MKTCPSCGAPNEDGTKYCIKCGALLDPKKEDDSGSSCLGCAAIIVILIIIIALIASCTGSCGSPSNSQPQQKATKVSKIDKKLGTLSGNKKAVVTALVKEHGFSYKQGISAWKIIDRVGCGTIELDKDELETSRRNRQKITGDLPEMGNDPMYRDVQILAVNHKLKSILLNFSTTEVGLYTGAITNNLKYGEHDVEQQATLWSAYDGYQNYYNVKKNAIVAWSKRP